MHRYLGTNTGSSRRAAITLIGKEAHRIEQRVSGELTIDDLDSQVASYQDDGEWFRVMGPRLQQIGTEAVGEATGVSERRVRDWLDGRAFPHSAHPRVLENLT